MLKAFIASVMLLASAVIFAQPDPIIDSLITQKSVYKVGEKISFMVNIHGAANYRSVSTFSCSCGNTDFFYSVYSHAKGQTRALYRYHVEKADQKKCECKYESAQLKDGKIYWIDAIQDPGTYQIVIDLGHDKMCSQFFTVSN